MLHEAAQVDHRFEALVEAVVEQLLARGLHGLLQVLDGIGGIFHECKNKKRIELSEDSTLQLSKRLPQAR